MFKNYIKIAWRNIIKNKVLSILNIIGLATGLLCSLLIYLWVSDELAVDNYHENIDRLYSVYQRQIFEGRVDAFYSTPALLYKELKNKIPEIEKAAPTSWRGSKTFAYKDKTFRQEGFHVGDDYFDMFSYDFLEGTVASVMDSPDNIAISEEMAQLFFGSVENAIGKSITYENSRPLQVSAVLKDASPANSKKADFFVHWDIFLEENSWAPDITNSGPPTFIMLKENSDVAVVQTKIKDFLTPYRTEEDANFTVELGLQPYGESYLHNGFENGIISGGRIENVRIFGFIAFFVLLIACINFMNLASASSIKRAKEVGVRKSLGAKKGSLISQFLGEALLLSLIGTILSLLLVSLLLPMFNELAGKDLSLLRLSPLSWSGIFGIALLTGFVSGSYPAFVLSSFKAIDTFKSNGNANASSQWVRKGLVVFQFALTVILISGMLITSRQINYIQHENFGFDRHNVVAFIFQGDSTHTFAGLKERVLQLPGVESVSITDAGPMQISNGFDDVVWTGKPDNDPTIFMSMAVGSDFAEAWGTELLVGSDFADDRVADNSGYIINETALKIMGLEDPIGKPLAMWGREGEIVGVMKDFPVNTLKSTIPPLIIRNGEYLNRGAVLARINPINVAQTVEALENVYAQILPEIPFQYIFTDAWYNDMYRSETVFFRLSQYFSLMAIFISCLGLFGLVIFSAQQRVKEIGIRKVLGASVSKITSLLIKDFLKLVVIGIVIGFPVAWYFMDKWLTNYEYRIDMPWWAFGLAGVLVIAIALLTVSFKSISAAMTNPVNSLRTE
ncbi:ABC transporter permease [Allomuricauda sp. SCSIO 65647]|uniref:ABC transporter permease n=1 Tax=Allomuricauda sp. SCSIO 65647 TaxID=2908843 RepID=UPI001F1C8B13|nr:ABC transporter permease [Muricauda sp. SCSIO 65647]UJH69164.1 ABC transporter permease [Muricauda sp. SCSIO 65647]